MAYPPLTGLFAERYMIERELGHGATAVVYLAHDTKNDRQIALKVLSKDLAHALGPERFLREIHLTARLHHPHILPIFDSGEWNGMLFYVLPFVSGESLRDKIDRENQLPIEECVRITCEVADALAHAHAHKIVHRDVKPENIMLSDGHALLADFGIARALDVHTGERLTSSGLIVGTSAYMSPEQAAGEERIDARSDIYSLACVLYEMIAGVQAFTGPTTQSVIAQRFKHTPRPVSTYRPQVPEYIERALEKALSISPADRYSKVKDFADDLSDTPIEIRDRRRAPLRRAIYGKQKVWGFIAAALVLITAAAVIANPPGHWRIPFTRNALLDSTKYAVIPFDANGRIENNDLEAATEIHRALGKWSGLELVDRATIADAVRAEPQMTIAQALELASKQGAGKLIRVNGSLDATLYDVATRVPLADVSREDLRGDTALYRATVTALLKVPDRPRAADGGDGRTASLPAWTAYGRAHSDLQHWNLAAAQREFDEAAHLDPSFAPAILWSAQVAQWTMPDSAARWAPVARRAASLASSLATRDSLLAVALGAMADGRFPDACATYRVLTKISPDDFAGWFGLGSCNETDQAVIPDTRSPSKWSFRSSYRAAAAAYEKALAISPEAHALIGFDRIQKLLPIASVKTRPGLAATPGKEAFLAYPEFVGDTLGFTPYPLAAFASISAHPTRRAALTHNLDELLAFAADWAHKPTASADAYEALAIVLEAKGNIDGGPAGSSALSAVREALRRSPSQGQALRLKATEVRLYLKLGQFEMAQALADSILGAGDQIVGADPAELTNLAAFTGKARAMSHFASEAGIPTAFGRENIPPGMKTAAAALFSFAALGICGSQTEAMQNQIEQQVKSYVIHDDRASVLDAAESRALSQLTPCTGGKSALKIINPVSRLYRAQQAFANGHFAEVRVLLDSTTRVRTDLLPGEASLDFTYQEAWLRAAIGDTTQAISSLDLTLDALPALGARMLGEPAAAAAFGRTMALRADLAAAKRDWKTARQWSTAVMILWSGADPELQILVARMKGLAAGKTGG